MIKQLLKIIGFALLGLGCNSEPVTPLAQPTPAATPMPPPASTSIPQSTPQARPAVQPNPGPTVTSRSNVVIPKRAVYNAAADSKAVNLWNTLRPYFAGAQNKGTVSQQGKKEVLVLNTPNGKINFDELAYHPKPKCRVERRAQRGPASWTEFQSPHPVALQLTRTSADYWRYDPRSGCLSSHGLWEAFHKERDAEELSNLWVILKPEDTITDDQLNLSTKNLKRKEVEFDYPSNYKKEAPLVHAIELGGSNAPETIRVTLYDVAVHNSSGHRFLFHSINPYDDFGNHQLNDVTGEYTKYVIVAVTVLRNKAGTYFVRITAQYDLRGMEDTYRKTQFWVYELSNGERAQEVAYKFHHKGDWSNDHEEDTEDYAYDTRKLRRSYSTPYGKVVHLIEKRQETILTYSCYQAGRRGPHCKPTHKRNTRWTFYPTSGKPIELFHQDWSE